MKDKDIRVQEHQERPEPISPDAEKNARNAITKAAAANEVMIELESTRKYSMISLVVILFVLGLTGIDITLGFAVSVVYVVYTAWKLLKSNQKMKYLKYTYGI